MAMSTNSVAILNFLKEHAKDNLTADDVAAMMDLPKATVNCAFTSAIARKGLGFRESREVELAEPKNGAKHAVVKFLRLTPEGMAYDPEAEATKAAD